MVREEILNGLELVRDILNTSDVSIVVVKNSQVLTKKKGDGIKPILDAIEELGEDMHESILGDRILGKASALLCRYANIKAVYSPQATKTAIALLIMGGIPVQVDHMIPYITNRDGSGLCPFERMLENVTDPENAYNILTEKIKKGFRTPQQAVKDPITGRDITGNFVSDHKKKTDEKILNIFKEAEKTMVKPSEKKAVYSYLSNKIRMILHDYYNSIKLPVDENILEEKLEKLAKILGIDK